MRRSANSTGCSSPPLAMARTNPSDPRSESQRTRSERRGDPQRVYADMLGKRVAGRDPRGSEREVDDGRMSATIRNRQRETGA